MPEALIVVDVQNGFLNDYTRHIPERIARLIDEGKYDPLLFTLFVNTPDSPYQRILDWHECTTRPDTELAPELATVAQRGRTFEKLGKAGMPEALSTYLRDHDVKNASIVGIDTDMCVLKVAMDAFDLGIRPTILVDCCASTGGLLAHLAGLAILSRNIGAQQLRDAGLTGGLIQAPTPVAAPDRA